MNSAQCYVAAWMGGGLGENGYMYMYGWVLSLFTWHCHNFVNWLYLNTQYKVKNNNNNNNKKNSSQIWKELQGSLFVLTGTQPSNYKMFFSGPSSWVIQREEMHCHWPCWNLSRATSFMKLKARIWRSLSFQVLMKCPSSAFCRTQKMCLKFL